MAQLSDTAIAGYAISAGFMPLTTAPIAVAIALAESGGNTMASHVNTDGSVDRGLWQINNKWHSEITDAQAYNPATAAIVAYSISQHGANFRQWATYNSGVYQQYLGRGTAAAAALVGTDTAANALAYQQSTNNANGVFTPNPATGGAISKAFSEIVAWVVVIVLLSLINKTDVGHTIVYDLLALAILSLILINYKTINSIVQPMVNNQLQNNDVVTTQAQAQAALSTAGQSIGSLLGR